MVGALTYFLLEFGNAKAKRTNFILERCRPLFPQKWKDKTYDKTALQFRWRI